MSIIENDQIRNFSNTGDLFKQSFFGARVYYRPLVMLSFMLEYHLFGLKSVFYNLSNIILHVVNAFLVFGIINMLLKLRRFALLGSILFLIHPLHVEAVANVPGRSILLCSLFMLLSFYSFMKAHNNQGRGSLFYILSLASFILALLSKESAVMMPFLLSWYLFCFNKLLIRNPRRDMAIRPMDLGGVSFQFLSRVSQGWFTLIPYFQALVVYFLWRKYLNIHAGFRWGSLGEGFLGIATFLKALIDYFLRMIFPHDLYYDSSMRILSSKDHLLIFSLIAGWLVLLGLYLKNRNKISAVLHFAVGWFFINLVTVSQLVPVKASYDAISTADHFLYLSLLGFVILIVIMVKDVYNHPRIKKHLSKKVLKAVLMGYILFFCLLTVQQTLYASQQIALFKRSLENNPRNLRVRQSLGMAYVMSHLYEEAVEQFRTILKYEPFNPRAQIALGKALCDQGRCAEGLQQYEQVKFPGELTQLLEENKRIVYRELISDYHELLKEDDQNAQIYYSIGVMHSHLGEVEQSISFYHKAIKLRERYPEALFNLATSYEYIDEYEKALNLFQQFVNLPKIDLGQKNHAENRIKELQLY